MLIREPGRFAANRDIAKKIGGPCAGEPALRIFRAACDY
jgi:hypothetical protein